MGTTLDCGGGDPPGFDVDGMLGRLAKWLRILGLDAAFPRSAPSEGRVFVTTKRCAPSRTVIRIAAGTLEGQVREVIVGSGIELHPDRIFSRCLLCNVPVRAVPRDSVARRVPVGVFMITSTFHECPECGRVYWQGSHEPRVRRRLELMEILPGQET